MLERYKFRGQRIDNGKWVVGSLVIRHGTYYILCSGIDLVKYDDEYEVFPESVGQYTGLKDKNRKEIWEGDIVSNNWGGIGVIVLCNGCWSIKWDEDEFDFLFAELEDHIEVIGNVIDNKELLNNK